MSLNKYYYNIIRFRKIPQISVFAGNMFVNIVQISIYNVL